MYVGWGVKWCPVSQPVLTQRISKKNKLVRAARETSKVLKTCHPSIPEVEHSNKILVSSSSETSYLFCD